MKSHSILQIQETSQWIHMYFFSHTIFVHEIADEIPVNPINSDEIPMKSCGILQDFAKFTAGDSRQVPFGPTLWWDLLGYYGGFTGKMMGKWWVNGDLMVIQSDLVIIWWDFSWISWEFDEFQWRFDGILVCIWWIYDTWIAVKLCWEFFMDLIMD